MFARVGSFQTKMDPTFLNNAGQPKTHELPVLIRFSPTTTPWKLITDLTVRTRREAVEKMQWYALRWKIEVFHKNLLTAATRVR